MLHAEVLAVLYFIVWRRLVLLQYLNDHIRMYKVSLCGEPCSISVCYRETRLKRR